MIMRIWLGYCNTVKKINDVSIKIAAVTLVLMAVVISLEIICRSFFGFSTLIADEYGGYLLCAATFFTASKALGEDGFLKVNILYPRFKGKTKIVIDLVIWLTALAYCAFLFWFCFYVAHSSYVHGIVSAYFSKTPLFIPQGIMALGAVLMMLQIIVEIGKVILAAKIPADTVTGG